MPKPGQPDDASTWKLRAVECAIPSQHLAIAQGVFGTLSDVYLLVIPIQSVFQLHLPSKRKIGVSAIFMIGIMCVHPISPGQHSQSNDVHSAPLHALSAVLHTARSSSPSKTQPGFPSQSIFSGNSFSSCNQYPCLTPRSAAEMSAGIICSSMPILASLFRGHAPLKFHVPSLRYFSSHFTSRTSQLPFISDKTQSSDNLHPSKRDSSLGQEVGDYMELESGTGFAKSNNAMPMERGD